MQPGAKKTGLVVGLSGDCVSKSSDTGETVYASPKPVDADGITLAPTAGDTLVFVDDKKNGLIFSTSVPFDPAAPAADWLKKAKASVTGAQIVLGGDTVGGWSKFGILQDKALFSGNTISVAIPAGGQYRTLPIADGSLTAEAGADQHSEVKLRTTLPEIMGAGNAQGQVDIQASNVAAVPVASASDPNDAARRALRRAHAADAPGPNLMPLDATSIGPIQIPGGTSLKFDPATQTWTDHLEGLTLPGLEMAGANATLDLVVRGSSLVSATGTLHVSDPGIPVATGVFLTSIDFTLVTSPHVLISAGAGITVGDIVSGHGELTIQPDPVDVRVDASLKVLGFLPLGSGFVEFTDGSLSFAGEAGYNFGPASLSASVSGGVNLDTKQFYVLGSGKACLFACVSAQAIVSSVGVAACGEVNLVLTSIEIGIGYRSGDLSLWIDSCGLESFKVPLTSAGTRVAVAAKTGKVLSGVLAPGSTSTITVPKGLKELAVQVQAPAGVGIAPHVTLSGPLGDPRSATNPVALGDYSFGLDGATSGPAAKQGTMLVDENPLDGATSIIVAAPKAGSWTLRIAPDSVPVASVRTAKPIDPTSVSKKMLTVRKGFGPGSTMVVGSRFVTVSKGAHAAAVGHPRALVRASALPKLERPRVRRLSYDIKTGDGGVALVDEGPSGSIVLAHGAAHGTRQGTVAFDPAGPGTPRSAR